MGKQEPSYLTEYSIRLMAAQPCLLQTSSGAGIRTLGGITPTTVFETVLFNRSGTPPRRLKRCVLIFSDCVFRQDKPASIDRAIPIS